MASDIPNIIKESLAYIEQGDQSKVKESLNSAKINLQQYIGEMDRVLSTIKDRNATTEIKKILSAYGLQMEDTNTLEAVEKESWYGVFMEKNVPTSIVAKIPGGVKGGTAYKGFKEGVEGRLSGGRVEEYHEWFINGWANKDYPKLLRKADKTTLVVAKEGSRLYVEFYKVLGLDKRFIDTRNFHGIIAYQLPREMMDEVWADLTNNRSNAYQLIDSELLDLISLPPNLKTVLVEE